MPVNAQQWLALYASDIPPCQLNQLQLDSRKVRSGDVFLAIPGVQQHGKQFIAQALAQGAALVLTDEGQYDDKRILVLPELMQLLPALAASFYQQPARSLQLVGITGTNGKSSTAFFVSQLAEQLAQKAAVIGTLGYGSCSKLTPLPNTTPHYVDIQRILSEAVAAKTQLVAMEVSSHALVQQRVAGLWFDAAVFTNLTRDHLDYHGSMAEYGAAKALLFTPQLSRAAVINVSDEFGRQLAAQSQLPVWAYGKAADCRGFNRYLAYDDVLATEDGYQLQLSSHVAEYNFYLPLLGEFNIQNVLAAMSSMLVLGYDLTTVVAACSQLKPVPGRMEQFKFAQNFTAVVDYAHTPDALQQALQSLRLHCKGKLWCVFGCGGDRDRGKRPLMGQLAELHADHVIITADNPRSEDVLSICEEIAAGMSPDGSYTIEPDRQSAIKLALISAQEGDVVLVAGKGHETIQIIGSEHRQYDERAYLRQLVAEMSA
ncbi:UDP-N-acetylmuramoyl-L-alanyl-D-glutamate--2,6-diaminopimelate ligase [Rheinheimera aquimaris]|uniref:UDP-N-acetylmuramoyl-L-alanyl-D-glutamate--2, 6-diaminopimelate ligase n=1 Tax=Rheinheimera aquimaris TaxID=412437 RepID=UPI001E5E9BCB|nr:UDP-N-acetylmuramoyl-L-alanyl-D-glutamate--2,6-diaminopimelate ligase [Rheinheimera aquimaris]MCD1597406.1 UDP-N-acetylmuramoyl-L-alanyl-D-glutamate--2,6-diaminopimelate ligase [Rheinheimera aquimaris]